MNVGALLHHTAIWLGNGSGNLKFWQTNAKLITLSVLSPQYILYVLEEKSYYDV